MKSLDSISQELAKILKASRPDVKNDYNQVTLSTQSQTIVIPKQSNSIRSSSRSRSV